MISNNLDNRSTTVTQDSDLNLVRKMKYFESKPSIDFYLMNYYDMYILNNTALMVNQYKEFEKTNKTKKINEIEIKYPRYYSNKIIRGVYFLSVSFFLIKTFQSVLIVPLFYLNVKFGNFILNNTFNSHDSRSCEDCYFCLQRKRYQIKTTRNKNFLNC